MTAPTKYNRCASRKERIQKRRSRNIGKYKQMRLKQLNSELGYSNLTGNLTEIQREEKCKTLVGTRIEISTSISNIRESDISLENESWSHMSLIQDSYDRDQLSIRLHFDKEKFGSQMLELNRQDGVEVTAKITSFTGTYPTYCELELISVAKVNDISKRINAEQEAKRKAAEDAERKCFIATACYGNYDASEVLVLRQFRDDKLLKTLLGKLFVKIYYFISPFFAELITKSVLLKQLVRKYFLEPIVSRLRRQDKLK